MRNETTFRKNSPFSYKESVGRDVSGRKNLPVKAATRSLCRDGPNIPAARMLDCTCIGLIGVSRDFVADSPSKARVRPDKSQPSRTQAQQLRIS